uniref:Uncharacterized protein n=1 Tax=Podoviridae sp. ctZkC8 TaxID=2825259 RepID=A0A8S5UC69_9CAUD|nr:MAG TPA: hypothetical protein [Podoviridae sp. ctZkC8]
MIISYSFIICYVISTTCKFAIIRNFISNTKTLNIIWLFTSWRRCTL